MAKDNNEVKKNLKKIQKATSKAIVKSSEHATAYVARVIKNSIKKRSGRKQTYKLNIYDWQTRRPLMTVAEYLSQNNHSNDRIVKWSGASTGKRAGQDNFREMKETAERRVKNSTSELPLSWSKDKTIKNYKSTWPNYWLRNSIRYDKKGGIVYSNPMFAPRALPLPAILERGGSVESHARQNIEGYFVLTRTFGNGQRHITFKAKYPHGGRDVNIKPHPFMRPGLEKARGHLPEIYRQNIEVALSRVGNARPQAAVRGW
jgi:hypothetical protein